MLDGREGAGVGGDADALFGACIQRRAHATGEGQQWAAWASGGLSGVANAAKCRAVKMLEVFDNGAVQWCLA
jgi:hypothetical protein